MKYSDQHAASTTQTDQKYKDLRPTIHAPSAEQVVRAIWRGIIPTIEQMLKRPTMVGAGQGEKDG